MVSQESSIAETGGAGLSTRHRCPLTSPAVLGCPKPHLALQLRHRGGHRDVEGTCSVSIAERVRCGRTARASQHQQRCFRQEEAERGPDALPTRPSLRTRASPSGVPLTPFHHLSISSSPPASPSTIRMTSTTLYCAALPPTLPVGGGGHCPSHCHSGRRFSAISLFPTPTGWARLFCPLWMGAFIKGCHSQCPPATLHQPPCSAPPEGSALCLRA